MRLWSLLPANAEFAAMLVVRAEQDAKRFGKTTLEEASSIVLAEHGTQHSHSDTFSVIYAYPDLRDMTFTLVDVIDRVSLSVLGNGPFYGFVLTMNAAGRPAVNVSKPALSQIGLQAKGLAAELIAKHGASDLSRFRRAMGSR